MPGFLVCLYPRFCTANPSVTQPASHLAGQAPARISRKDQFILQDLPYITSEVYMIETAFANHFAADWINSWNKHDLVRILSHYADDFEMSSPVIVKIVGEPSGTLKGKEAVGAYWAKALRLIPDLHFELVATLVGVNSITLYYNGVRGLSAEVFHFNHEGKVSRAYAHYLSQVTPL